MNLKDLAALQHQQSQLSQRRHLQAAEAVSAGFALLAQAETDHYADRSLLMRACDHFAEAIAQHRLNPEPLLGMALILFLLRDYTLARGYLAEVRRLQPDHPDLAALEAAMRQPDQPLEAESLFDFEAEPDLDYDELEARLHVYFRDLSARQLDPRQLIVDEASYCARREEIETQRQVLDRFGSDLDRLEREFDTGCLRRLLLPVQQLLRRSERQLEASTQARNLQSRLGQIQQQVLRLQTAELSGTEAARRLERALEQQVDACDACADALDALESAGFIISPIETIYQRLTQLIEAAFERVDEQLETRAA